MAEPSRSLYYSALGAIVAHARKRKKLSQDDLAKRVGVSQPTITRLENGVWAVPAVTMSVLARYLDLGGAEQLYKLVATTITFIERAADAIRPGSLERVAPHGLATFVVAALERSGATSGRRRRT